MAISSRVINGAGSRRRFVKERVVPNSSGSVMLYFAGIAIIVATWIMYVVSIGIIFDFWEWAFAVPGASSLAWLFQQSDGQAVRHYYVYIFFLNFVIVWLWCVISWISMKLFRHSKGGG